MPLYFLLSEEPAKIYELSPKASYALTSQPILGGGINDFAWRMIQVSLRLFIIGGYIKPRRFTEFRQDGKGSFMQVERTNLPSDRWFHGVCSQSDQFIYVSGGAYKAD